MSCSAPSSVCKTASKDTGFAAARRLSFSYQRRCVTDAEVKKTPGVNFQVCFVNSETNNMLPARFGKGHVGAKKSAFVPLGPTTDVRGPEKRWVLLERS